MQILSKVSFCVCRGFFQEIHFLPVPPRVLDFTPRTLADIAAHIDYVDGIRHIDLSHMHVVEHLLGARCPDFIVAGMPEQPDADDDVAFKGKLFLRLHKGILETRTAAESYDWVFADHNNSKGC